MEYKRLGNTGMLVSPLALGCMTFGVPERGTHPWTLDEEASRPLIREALEAGINFFDTANSYSAGTSEEIVGRALKEYARRDEIVLATKVYFGPGDAGEKRRPNTTGLSRKAIFEGIDASLRRLGTDYVDLYQIHRWDYHTPIEETMEALHDVVKAGKVRYIGASSMYAWQFAKALHVAEANGWTRFVTMQNHLNLLYREEEREMLPLCRDEGIGVIPWSPLARGRLARAWDDRTARDESDAVSKKLYGNTEEADRRVVEAVGAIAAARGVPRAQVALAWVIGKAGVTAPIIGASRSAQFQDAIAALQLQLTEDEVRALEAPYVPHVVTGFE
ncbi:MULTISPECIES: aldo/keto reductase [unclassified Achromobacter]|uniref:aldo/keto reductase n=1 Tax=unclassified Achromobacter TaxID=2626865 RepID=UPI000B51A6C5|nr:MULTISPECIES: aldo/keto reductase [unclassified Achromobacter]OWT75498.1 alcohol dehydrogenase [Achromobacter sp. HZ28]OWT76158.1 alcohol dehydrogenase [Achromobacter sp. HZ34]